MIGASGTLGMSQRSCGIRMTMKYVIWFWLPAVFRYICIFLCCRWITKHWQRVDWEHGHLTSCSYPTKMLHRSHLGLKQWPRITVKLSWNSTKAELCIRLLSWKQNLALFGCSENITKRTLPVTLKESSVFQIERKVKTEPGSLHRNAKVLK